jgi:hypothetical protein
MRRSLIVLWIAALVLIAPGCSWYPTFRQRFGSSTTSREPGTSRIEAEKEEAREPD